MRRLTFCWLAAVCVFALSSLSIGQGLTPAERFLLSVGARTIESKAAPLLVPTSEQTLVPTWSLNYAFGVGKPHNSFAIVSNTLKAKSNLFGLKNLSALAIMFAGTQLQSPASTAPQGLTAGLGAELAYSLGGNLFASGGLGYAYSAGQQGHLFWLVGGTLKF